jgi:hypothetical protein
MICRLACLALLGILLGCTRENTPSPEAGYGYFPLQTRAWIEYEVTETRYALGRPSETRTYRLKETIGEKYTDATGQDVYRVERAIWKNDGWMPDSMGAAWRTTDGAFRNEHGVTFVKLRFPIGQAGTWDGNLFNTRREQLYELRYPGEPVQIGQRVFDKTVGVIQLNDSTLLSLRRSQELYAEGVGLIGWEHTDVNYCGTPDCVGRGIIDYGFRRTGILITYQNE